MSKQSIGEFKKSEYDKLSTLPGNSIAVPLPIELGQREEVSSQTQAEVLVTGNSATTQFLNLLGDCLDMCSRVVESMPN